MNELGVSALSIMPLAISLVTLILGLVLWFFVNRSSSRANEQIALLEELVDLQKRQNALLRRLCEANEPEPEHKPTAKAEEENDDDFVRLVAER
ncbi:MULTISPECIES: YebO family protein [unclassified Cedecea]|uniref:YebO family protein n=1 Tax=unclassified Cedecea TaxID=2649846 RepID=UPI0030181628